MSEAESGAPVSLAEMERQHIARTLVYTGGNRRDAARLLGIARSTLLAKIRRYGLEDVMERSAAVPDEK
jgi:DNA-binding NtrC family response regulator